MKGSTKTQFSQLAALIAAMMLFMVPSRSSGQGLQAKFYFAAAPAINSPNYNAALSNIVVGMQNPAQSPVLLTTSGGNMSITNGFTLPGETNGYVIVYAADVKGGSPFIFTNMTWTVSTPNWSFTNVWTSWNFGPGFMGTNGKVLYTSGSANNVPLTEVWVARQYLEYDLNPGQTTDQALTAFESVQGPSMPLTFSCSANSNTVSGILNIVVNPPLYICVTNQNRAIVSWPIMYPTWPFVLEQKSDLNMTNWVVVPGTQGYMSSPTGDRNFVTVTNATGSNIFFRLHYGN